MSNAAAQLEAGGLILTKAKVDAASTEQIVARAYRHPALGDRAVIRLAPDRLGQAEDLAMEFLGFLEPEVSAPLAVQQRRSLGFAAWALVNDPANARFALDLVKQMKAAARQARSKPGHGWDAYTAMATELGRSVRHFLPPFWEEVGRTFKDFGNQTYAGRALNKSLEAERVHALESDRARRRDVILEFVLSGCLTSNALSDYGADLQGHYPPREAFDIFRDLCVRRTNGGMPPWATLPKDFTKLAKAAGLDGDKELEKWLEEVIESPAMGRPPLQFWKTCGGHCKRIVARNPAFALALLRHTKPEPRYYGDSKLGPWIELLDEWGVLEYLWKDKHKGAPPLGEPIAAWFSRIVRDAIPAPQRTLAILEKLAPRLKKENEPLSLSIAERHRSTDVDIDVLEACLALGIKVGDPPPNFSVSFSGWLSANIDHPFRNQDIAYSAKDERFKSAIMSGLEEALACRGGEQKRGYQQAALEQRAFPLAAGDRPGIKGLWRLHTTSLIDILEESGLASFEMAESRLASTLWPEALRLFPELAERLMRVNPVAMLRRTLQAGVFEEYGLPAFEETIERNNIKIQYHQYWDNNIHLTFPSIVVSDKIHAFVIGGDGEVAKHELRLPKKSEIVVIVAVGDDLAVNYRDEKYQGRFYWVSDPAQHYDASGYWHFRSASHQAATALDDGSVFLGEKAVRTGDKQMPVSHAYVHDGERFWSVSQEYDQQSNEHHWKIREVDPHTGKPIRESVPPWFEETDGGTIELSASDLRPAPPGAKDSPLGMKDGMIGWKTVKRRDGSYFGLGIDGRRWDKPLIQADGTFALPVALLRQAGTNEFLPVTTSGPRVGNYWIWDPSGSTVVTMIHDFESDDEEGRATVLPLQFWHFLRARDQVSSRKLRGVSHPDSAALLKAAAEDRAREQDVPRGSGKGPVERKNLLAAVKRLLPEAPERMALGVASVIERAGQECADFIALRDKASTESTKETQSATSVINRKSDIAAVHWGLRAFQTYGDDRQISLSEHLAAVAAFLKGTSKGGDLPQTNCRWFSMLENLPLRCWQAYWRAMAAKMNRKDKSEVAWLAFLKFWHDLGIADLPGVFDIMEGYPEGAKKNAWGGYDVEATGSRAFAIKKGEDLFIAIASDDGYYQPGLLPYQFLRYSTARTPGSPPGYKVKNLRRITAHYDRAQIEAFVTAVESCIAPPLPSLAELQETAKKLSASPAEIGLIWLGGLNVDSYENNFLPGELRTALGLKTADASAGRQALRNLNPSVLTQLYEAVVSHGCAAPFAADRTPVLRLIETAWQAKMPKRLQIEAALQTRLSALGKASRWQRLNHETVLAVAADPAKHPLLKPRELEFKVDAKKQRYGGLELAGKDKGEGVDVGDSLRSIVQLVALVHAETAAGHPCRAEMPALIKQTTMLLNSPTVLFELRSLQLYDGQNKSLKPSEWLNTHVGKIKANPQDGTARFDDGFITAAALDSQLYALIAYRPAKLKDQGDMARLQGILALGAVEGYSTGDGYISVVAAIKSLGFQKLAKAILAKNVPEGQWPQNPNHTAAAVVKAIRTKYKLGQDAAVLYAQVLALPDPTTANVRNWNGWTAAQLKTASAELIGRKLVLEAVRERAGRSIFLPGEWTVLKAPWLPIERWKLVQLVELELNPGVLCPAGGPMVLRPFEDVFAEAWQRVLGGDGPRYEEVKRRKKTK
jgi:hypothetical protein